MRTLDADRQASVNGAIDRLVAAGPTLGRPRVDRIHGSSLHKLKELRGERGLRVLFAFDSNRRPVMLVGGDKTRDGNRWYPPAIRTAEALLQDHERRIGKEPPCPSRGRAARTPPRSR